MIVDCAETKEVQEYTIKTKDGTKYLNSVRESYCSLLSIGITPDKINSIVHLVLSKLYPSIDINDLKLP